ncbi:TATA box-binding protein-associated factor RNA polymerase I subunit B [Saguinus oedipus]|uniref:TATA box-binding protein-associated factor RNA polymerase I subunit B n=1 Tax=Saguinus oedipus TaxID=9490 RepID=A0ABQ9U8F6_SAGOE|nr:TATA box-binding protein-associated factor RNA polymerase I subunit B [Saguinus oedipus]
MKLWVLWGGHPPGLSSRDWTTYQFPLMLGWEEFKERCTQCETVSWGLTDEGKYYCTSCHNVTDIVHWTDRSKEVINSDIIPNAQIKALNRGLKRKNNSEKGWDWYVCEGFQYILYQQAEALKNLGVGPELKERPVWCSQFENKIVWCMYMMSVRTRVPENVLWTRYLQKSKQAYCKNPVYTTGRKPTVLEDNLSHSDWASEPELLSDVNSPFLESGMESQSDVHTRKSFRISKASQSGKEFKQLSALDLWMELNTHNERRRESALILKEFVEEDHIPYINAFQHFPEQMKLYGRDRGIFGTESLIRKEWYVPEIIIDEMSVRIVLLSRKFASDRTQQEGMKRKLEIESEEHFPVTQNDFLTGYLTTLENTHKTVMYESWPNYDDIYKKTIEVATFLDLPRFPDITEDCYLHPNILCMKYLMEVNLPDEMHSLTCHVVKMTGMGEVDFLTFDPIAKVAKTVKYDVKAVAIIVVVLKLLFLLDDNLEWSLSNLAEKHNEKNKKGKQIANPFDSVSVTDFLRTASKVKSILEEALVSGLSTRNPKNQSHPGSPFYNGNFLAALPLARIS